LIFDIGVCCVGAIVIIMVYSFFVFFMFWYRVVGLGCNSCFLACGVYGWAMCLFLFLCFVVLG
jgi:hypothetical protein